MNVKLKIHAVDKDVIEVYGTGNDDGYLITTFHRDFLYNGHQEALDYLERDGEVNMKLILQD